MAKMRAIRPEIFEDQFVGTLDYFQRWLWIGLFAAVADDQGRFWVNPLKIRAILFAHPKDAKVTDDEIMEAIKHFEAEAKLHIYWKDGKSIGQIVSWWKNQQPRWASKSEYPAPDQWHDRERYSQGQGKQPHTTNWELPGGFARAEPTKIKNGSPAHNMYADNIDVIGPFEDEWLNQAVSNYTQEWVVAAIEISIKNNVKNLAYIGAILEKWKAAGHVTAGKKDSHKDYLDDEFAQFIE